jgi:RHS repeat-associated protein
MVWWGHRPWKYTYQVNSNKIQAVTDNSNETASFTDVAGAIDYTYNPDGSLKSDANKGITLFEYNYTKQPKKVTYSDGKTISYQYSASGKKLKETTSTGDITDYVGNVIYKNGSVYQVSHDEGRTVNNVFEYDIKDHLGSLRVSFKDSLGIAKVTQESHTGIFGEILPSLVYTNTPKVDNFDYTEHERLKTFDLAYIDAGARLYDPFVPRFTTIDPLAGTSRRFSPFTYGNNNPIRFIDPDGMEAKGFEYSDGYSTQNSANETGSVSHEGAFLNAGGEDDKPKGKKEIDVKFNNLWEKYPGHHIDHKNPKTDKEQYDNQCAIELSESLLKNGVSLKNFSGGTCSNCSVEQKHALVAQQLATFLLNKIKFSGTEPVYLTGKNYEDYVDGKTGIIFFKDYWHRDSDAKGGRTGDHIDLWNKNELGSVGWGMTWLRQSLPTVTEYLLRTSDLTKSKQVIFWEIK